MARPPENTSRRKKPAYPRPGTGEDFPAKRPGTKTGESQSGAKIMQRTRASQRNARNRSRSFGAKRIPLAQPRSGERATAPNWRGQDPRSTWPFSADVRGKPTRRDPWPL
jgi:hypothetical protein